VSGLTKTRREPRRAAKFESPWPRERRVDAAIEILGKGVQRSDVEVVLDRMAKEAEELKAIRSSFESGRLKAFAKQYGAALGKVIALMEKAPPTFRTLPGLGYRVAELGIGTEVVRRNKQGEPINKRKKPIFAGEVFPSNDKLLRHLRLLLWICQQWNRKLKPKPNADDRRLAVRAALILGEAHGMRLVTTKGTKGGNFANCRRRFGATPTLICSPIAGR
jgi:hypothetical protein